MNIPDDFSFVKILAAQCWTKLSRLWLVRSDDAAVACASGVPYLSCRWRYVLDIPPLFRSVLRSQNFPEKVIRKRLHMSGFLQRVHSNKTHRSSLHINSLLVGLYSSRQLSMSPDCIVFSYGLDFYLAHARFPTEEKERQHVWKDGSQNACHGRPQHKTA